MMNLSAQTRLRSSLGYAATTIIQSVAFPALVTALTAVNALGALPPPPDMPPYRLSRNDIAELANMACTSEFGSREKVVRAWRAPRGDKRGVQAVVECTAHRTYPDFEAYHAAHCERREQWRCGRGETRIRGTQPARRIDIGLGGYNPNIAYELVNKIAAYRTKKGDAVIDTEDIRCDLARDASKEMINVTCKDRAIRISYWCPQSACPRIFSVNGYFVPADSGGL